MPALASRQTRRLAAVPGGFGARAVRLGLFSFSAAAALAASALGGCGAHDPHAVAVAADKALGAQVYSWLADHDPSRVIIYGLAPDVTRAVAPDAAVEIARDIADGCGRAKARHGLLAAVAHLHSDDRYQAENCGYVLYRDDATVVIAPL